MKTKQAIQGKMLIPNKKTSDQNPTNSSEMRAIPARTQTAAPKSELGMSDLHRNSADKMGNKPAAAIMPRRSGSPGVRS